MTKTLKRDLCLVSILLCVSLSLVLLLRGTRAEGNQVVVEVNGNIINEYSLAFDGEYVLNGGTNILKIENGCACLIDADCPDKLCIKQGKIKYNGQCITCLPNKLTVTVYNSDTTVDFVL